MNEKQDVIVIGGGIIGVASAYYLARQGRSVTLLEKDEINTGSSFGNAGLIANGFVIPMAAPGMPTMGLKMLLDSASPFFLKPRLNLELIHWLWKFCGACNKQKMLTTIPVLLSLSQGNMDLFAELLTTEGVDFGYQRQGRLILFTSSKSFQSSAKDASMLREFGVESSLLDAAGVRKLEPNVLPAVTNGIYCADYAHLPPDGLVQGMADLGKKYGVKLKTGISVTGFETSGQQISAVITTAGTFTASQVVMAAGAWSPELSKKLQLRLPIQPAKGYSLTYKRPDNSPQLPLSLAERKIAVTPMGEMLRCSSILELAGFDSSIPPQRLDIIRRAVQEYLPGMEKLEEETAWYGYRPVTPDDLPIIGRTGKLDNLVLATGNGTLGITQGLMTGKLVAQIIAGEKPDIDLTPFRAERF